MTTYKVIAVNDQEHTCSHCGKTNLKKVAWLVALDHDGNDMGQPEPWGTTCAARALAPRNRDYSHREGVVVVNQALTDQMWATVNGMWATMVAAGALVVVAHNYALPELVTNFDGRPGYHFGKVVEAYGLTWQVNMPLPKPPNMMALDLRNKKYPFLNDYLPIEQRYAGAMQWLAQQAAA